MIVNISKEIDISKIRMERARLKISQLELARRVSREKINAIENAKCKRVKYELLENIATIFNLKPEDLLKKVER